MDNADRPSNDISNTPGDDFRQVGEFLRLLSTGGWDNPTVDVLCRAFTNFYSASWSMLYHVDKGSGNLILSTQNDLPDGLDLEAGWPDSIVKEVFRTGLGICLNGNEAESRSGPNPPRGHSVMTIPLFIKGMILGVVVLGRPADIPFSDEDVDASISLSPFAALFLSNLLIVTTVVEQKTEIAKDREKLLELNTKLEQNIKQLRNNSGQLEKALEELSETNRARTEFFENLSHELRTPLTPILASSEALLGKSFGNITDEQKEIVEVLFLSAKRLELLIEDLLELVKLESKSLKLEIECLDISSIVDESILETVLIAKDREVEIRNELGEGVPLVSGDKKRLSQLIVNLLHNAIKFSHEGGVVRIELDRSKERNDLIGIRVMDEGIGIHKKMLDKIFERFYQADKIETGGGLGLGLAIVKKIVDAHQGEVKVVSREGKGSSFTVYLPIYRE
jgi:signal transduction histidine kinase